MTKKEKEILNRIIDEIQASDDQIDQLVYLYEEVKRMLGRY